VLGKAAYGTVVRDVLADKVASEAAIRAGGPGWALVHRGAAVTDGPGGLRATAVPPCPVRARSAPGNGWT
jgi:hypothetical protein